MSQITILPPPVTPGPGPVQTITGDVGGAVSADGTSTIYLVTGPGLTSTGVPVNNTIIFTLDGLTQATAQTIGAVTADIITINLGAVPTTWIVEAKIVGFEATTPAGCGYNLIGVARTNGVVGTLVSAQDKYNAEEATLLPGDANFVVVGNSAIIRVLGTIGLTINWKATTVQMGV
jgi:hypothetical protein